MDELIRRLHEALAKARGACSIAKPPAGADIGFFFGEKQGICSGLERALKLVDGFLNDIDEQNGDNQQ
jgi:hypothetical protein